MRTWFRLLAALVIAATLLSVLILNTKSRITVAATIYPPSGPAHDVTANPKPLVRPTKDITIRSVYWDNRPRNGHKSACVFMVEILRTALETKSIVGCIVGSSLIAAFKIRPVENMGWVLKMHFASTYIRDGND